MIRHHEPPNTLPELRNSYRHPDGSLRFRHPEGRLADRVPQRSHVASFWSRHDRRRNVRGVRAVVSGSVARAGQQPSVRSRHELSRHPQISRIQGCQAVRGHSDPALRGQRNTSSGVSRTRHPAGDAFGAGDVLMTRPQWTRHPSDLHIHRVVTCVTRFGPPVPPHGRALRTHAHTHTATNPGKRVTRHPGLDRGGVR